MVQTMARLLLKPNPDNATISELKELARIGSSETALRCTALQMLLNNIDRKLVCSTLLVSDRSIRNWINAFNKSGADGLIVNRRPGRTQIIRGSQAGKLSKLRYPLRDRSISSSAAAGDFFIL